MTPRAQPQGEGPGKGQSGGWHSQPLAVGLHCIVVIWDVNTVAGRAVSIKKSSVKTHLLREHLSPDE